MKQTQQVSITTPYIQLDQFLKWAAIAETGGHAKELIEAGMVMVNGNVASERRKKLYPGDIVVVEDAGTFSITAD